MKGGGRRKRLMGDSGEAQRQNGDFRRLKKNENLERKVAGCQMAKGWDKKGFQKKGLPGGSLLSKMWDPRAKGETGDRERPADGLALARYTIGKWEVALDV